jgi:signal transduction histidine kinase
MKEAKLNKIFEHYGPGRHGRFLCKQLAEIMKGALSVTSEYGKGSVFTFCVPQKLV